MHSVPGLKKYIIKYKLRSTKSYPLTAVVDNMNDSFPDEFVDWRFRFGACFRRNGLIVGQESESHGTAELSVIGNVRCGSDTVLQDLI